MRKPKREKPLLLMNEKIGSNFSFTFSFIWATTQMRLLPLFLQQLLNGSFNSQIHKHQLISILRLQLVGCYNTLCSSSNLNLRTEVLPCSTLPPLNSINLEQLNLLIRNHSLKKQTCNLPLCLFQTSSLYISFMFNLCSWSFS